MNLSQQLQQSGAIGAMARELGVDEATAQKGAQALLPAIVAGLGRNQVGAGGTRANAAGGGLADILSGGLGGGPRGTDDRECPGRLTQGWDIWRVRVGQLCHA